MLSTAFDPIFAQFAGVLPVPFLRALSYKESTMRPDLHDGPAVGLLQVVPILQKEWNQRTGQNITQDDLKNPAVNTQVASDLLNRIIGYYKKHPSPNLQPNFANPEFVKLLVAGWNSGYSESAGVGKVATYLEKAGIPVTHDNIFKYANAAGGIQYLQEAGRYNWQKSVADLFYQQPDAQKGAAVAAVAQQKSDDNHFLLKAGVATVAGLLVAWFAFR